MQTILTMDGEKFLINGMPTYQEIDGSATQVHGLLMNARFIQGLFHDRANEQRFHRFGRTFDADKNTDDLIAALPSWYAMGLRAFTVGLQGGGSCFTIPNHTVQCSPYSPDGMNVEANTLARLTRLLNAADQFGMVVIVSLFYCGQIRYLDGAKAVLSAVRTMSRFLKQGGWRNIILEIANEYDLQAFRTMPLIQSPEGMVALMDIARQESGLAVGCSGAGGTVEKEVVQNSDVVLYHGNGQSRQQLVMAIEKIRHWAPNRPIVCNEDSQCVTNMQVCVDHGVSWGYYNNMTKQEPPTDWRILPGEDSYFTWRMANALGIRAQKPIPSHMVVGVQPWESSEGKFWIRLAALYPEQIDYVDYWFEDQWQYRCYEAPFSLHYQSNWLQDATTKLGKWHVEITWRNGNKQTEKFIIGAFD